MKMNGFEARQELIARYFQQGVPLSFDFGGKPLDVSEWECERVAANDTVTALTMRHKSGVTITCDVCTYPDYPVIDWSVRLSYEGEGKSPMIENLRPVQVRVPVIRDPKNGFSHPVLHHFVGSPCAGNDFEPRQSQLTGGVPLHFSTFGGRSSNTTMPYFNVQTTGQGVILAVGWAGQWEAQFQRYRGEVEMWAGQENTHFCLLPGETLKGPRTVMLFYEGDYVEGQNIWRAWMRDHNQPKGPTGRMQPMQSACNGNYYEQILTDAKTEKFFLDQYEKYGIHPDYWWQDAGWYPCEKSWVEVGTWEMHPERFPNGIKEVSHAIREEYGMQTIVWFEPERVMPGTWIYENKPEWIFTLPGRDTALLRIGDEECRKWITDKIDSILCEQEIDIYRQDFNMEPLEYWRADDAEDRQGVAEMKHIEGYLAFWDALLERHPGMFIDTCASGGRRLDVETLKRSVSLLRSDYTFYPDENQCHTYGLSFWLPFNGTGFMDFDEYSVRSMYLPELTLGADTRRDDLDYRLLRRLSQECRVIAPMMLEGDYYPMTSYSQAKDVWMAWQFHHQDKGFVQAFRREESLDEVRCFRLRGLKEDAKYEWDDMDGGERKVYTGAELMKGIEFKLPRRKAAIYCYREI